MLPSLSRLSLSTGVKTKMSDGDTSDEEEEEEPGPVASLPITRKRIKTRGDSEEVYGFVYKGTQEKQAWERDKVEWRDRMCEMWGGMFKDSVFGVELSPDHDWKKRRYEVSSKITTDANGQVSCMVVDDTFGFDPNGIHFVKQSHLEVALNRHYKGDNVESKAKYDRAVSNLPDGGANTADIEAWSKKLDIPDWYSDFAFWKKNVMKPSVQKSANDGVGKIEYPLSNTTYVGQTKRGEGKFAFVEKVPHGVGSVLFNDGSFWNGSWINGQPRDLGVFTDEHGDKTVGRWDAEYSRFTSASDIAKEELEIWQYTHARDVITDLFLVEKPGYGRVSVASGLVGGVLRAANWHTATAIARMFETTNPFELGKGRDANSYMSEGYAYTKLIPLAVFDVDYSNSHVLQKWSEYQNKVREQVQANKKHSGTDDGYAPSGLKYNTRMDNACPASGYEDQEGDQVDSNLASIGVPLDKELNERFLLHATKPQAIFQILNTSFDISYASKGLFGSGIYFSDDPGKCDQYATPDPLNEEIGERLGVATEHVQNQLMDHVAISEENETDNLETQGYDIFFMFVTRMALGVVAEPESIKSFQQNKLPVADPRSTTDDDYLFRENALLARAATDASKVNMASAQKLSEPYGSLTIRDALRYREFIVYKNAIARVSQLVVYCRARKTRLTKHSPYTLDRDGYGFGEETAKLLLYEDGTGDGYQTDRYEDPFRSWQ